MPEAGTGIQGLISCGRETGRSTPWFDAEKTQVGREALQHYRRDYNQRLKEFTATPVHDWASHGADAFRGLAVRYKPLKPKKPRRDRFEDYREVPRDSGGLGWMSN